MSLGKQESGCTWIDADGERGRGKERERAEREREQKAKESVCEGEGRVSNASARDSQHAPALKFILTTWRWRPSARHGMTPCVVHSDMMRISPAERVSARERGGE